MFRVATRGAGGGVPITNGKKEKCRHDRPLPSASESRDTLGRPKFLTYFDSKDCRGFATKGPVSSTRLPTQITRTPSGEKYLHVLYVCGK